MPPTEKSVLLWSATFAPGRTFRNYVGRLRKVRSLLGSPSDCATKAAYAAADGLRKARKGTFKFPNFLFATNISNLVDFLGWDRGFTLLAFVSFLSPLRVPSEALLLRMAFRDEPIGEPVNRPEKALAGVRSFKGVGALVIKMSWRENLEGGCILKRTCICGGKFAPVGMPSSRDSAVD